MPRSKSAKQFKNKQSKRSKQNRRAKASKNRKAKRDKLRTNCMDASQAIQSFFGHEDIFSDYQFHGNIKWSPEDLVKMALIFSWSEKRHVTDAFIEMLKRCNKLGITTTLTTYQGFMGALANYAHVLIPRLVEQLQEKMQQAGGEFWQIAKFVPIAFDGSRNSASRTESNEQELCSAKGKKKAIDFPSVVTDPKPQAWITLLWHMGLRMPWDWRLGPSDSSERRHVQEMLGEGGFPENTLFVGDAGFVGYDFWRSMLDRGHHFMVRVGSNVKLISDMVDYHQEGDEVLCWPKDKQNKQPPLRLRLVRVEIGNAEVYLLTSVLSSQQLPASAMTLLYKKRWGIEIEFRGLKQTLDGQRLCCRNVDRLYAELHFSILAMAVAELLAIGEQLLDSREGSSDYTPQDRSLAGTMRAIYDCLDELSEVVPRGEDLFSRLAAALTDRYQRKSSKKARYRPRQSEKKKKKIKPPKIRSMNEFEREKLKQMGLTVAA